MFIESLTLDSLRNLAPQTITFGPEITYLSGENGRGKTTIVEAIYLLAHGRSFRGRKSAELVQWGAERGAFVEGHIRREVGVSTISLTIPPPSARGQRVVIESNGSRIPSLKQLYGRFRVLEFTPDDLDIVKGNPTLRRRLIDRTFAMVSAPFMGLLIEYHHVLKQRNALLREVKTLSETKARELLLPWDMQLVSRAIQVSTIRDRVVSELLPFAQAEYEKLLIESGKTGKIVEGCALELLSFLGRNSNQRADATSRQEKSSEETNSEELIQAYLGELQERMLRDIRTGGTGWGAHRDDLLLSLIQGDEKVAAREFASQGQCRSLVIALKLGLTRLIHAHTGHYPVVLLDDVESELDSKRTASLYASLIELGAQIILTGVSGPPPQALIGGASITTYEIERGGRAQLV